MAVTITKAYVNTYESNVRHLSQQGMSRLRPFVMERSVQSEAHNWQNIAESTAIQKTARKVATPDGETVWSRRVSVPVTYHVGDTCEPEDVVQMLVDPNSNYAKAHAMAMRRAYDDEIIRAATGTALDGDGNANAFLAGQRIGNGTAAITFDGVTQIVEKFTSNDVDPEEMKVMVIGPKQARQLLALVQATSGDYNAVRPLTERGYIQNWMGFHWIVSTRLLAPAAGQLSCFAMTADALGLQVNKDVWARAEEDPTISFAYRIYCASTYGAVRVQDKKLVEFRVLN